MTSRPAPFADGDDIAQCLRQTLLPDSFPEAKHNPTKRRDPHVAVNAGVLVGMPYRGFVQIGKRGPKVRA
jgi:hypothetical protein